MWLISNIYFTIFMLAVIISILIFFEDYIHISNHLLRIWILDKTKQKIGEVSHTISNYLSSISISEMNEKMICRYLFLILKLPKHRLLDLPIKKWPKMWTKQPRMTKHEIWIFRACTSWWLIWNIVAFIYQMICFNVFI